MLRTFLNIAHKLAIITLLVLLCGLNIGKTSPAYAVTGDISTHDPSMIKAGSCYYLFSTGGTISIRQSCTLVSGWAVVGNVFNGIPSWINSVIGSTPTDLWAPDINFFNGKYYLYYAGSTFGSNKSVIGLATATTITGPWTDQGEVLHSTTSNNYNAIDPNLAWDSQGQAWLSFGSFWDGIKMRQIDPTTGKLLSSNTTLYSLASRGGGAIEASSILHAGNFYYLFVSFDKCCAGVNSTYRIMVGRSNAITGPYVDKNGTNMMNGGATQLLATSGQFIGPGGEDVMADGSTNWLVYHYYDGNDGGKSKLALRTISIDSTGWPVLGDMLGSTPPPTTATATKTLTPASTKTPTFIPVSATPSKIPSTTTQVPPTKTNTPGDPTATTVPTKTNTPIPTTGPTATVNASDPCASPTVITGGGTFTITTASTCFKYVNTTFVNGGMFSVMKDASSASDALKWYGGMDQNATACANQSATVSGNGGQLNNFTVAKDSNGQMFLIVTGNGSNSVTISIQNWQNGSGCSAKPTVHP